jgi:hypothetical protein
MSDGEQKPEGALAKRTPGKLDLEHSSRDMRMARRALRNGWLPKERISAVLERAADVAINSEDDRAAVTAQKLVVESELKRVELLIKAAEIEKKSEAPQPPTNQPIINISIANVLDEARRDPAYVQFERQRAIEDGLVAGAYGHDGEQRTLEVSSAPRTD